MSDLWRFGRQYDFHEIVVDGVGIVFALVGAMALIFYATVWGSLSAIAAAWIYGLGLGLVVCLFVSFIYNIWPHSNVKWFLRRLDHSEIFILIVAGGVIYSLGVIFHVWEKLLFQNAIWHGFVVAAAAVHYFAVVTSFSLVSLAS